MEPTQSQLDARLNPTPTTLSYTPGGVFLDSNDPWKTSVYSYNPTTQSYGQLNLGQLARDEANKLGYGTMTSGGMDYRIPGFSGSGSLERYGASLLQSKYGIDINSLQSQNFADAPSVKMGAMTPEELQSYMNASTSYTPSVTVNTGLEAPSITNIGNPIPAPTSGSSATTPAPSLPQPQAAQASETYITSLTGQIETAKAAVQAEADKRATEYQKQIDDLKAQQADFQTKMDAGLAGIDTATQKTLADKQAALELEKQRFDENYTANQALIGEMDSLLTTGNKLVEEMKGTTGLSSIMNPRIAKTMSDVQARAGVIQAVLSARNGQMSYAQQQLGTTFDALSSMLTDQTNYYKTVISFYDSQKTNAANKELSLTKDQKDYLDVKLNMLNNDLTQLQATKNILSKAMMDPDTASSYAMAGVTMNDSPELIGKKLAQYAYSQELVNTSNKMTTAGYTSTPIAGVTPTVVTDSQGNTKSWYKKGANVELSPGATLVDANGKVITTAPTAAQTTAGGTTTQAQIDQLKANQDAAAKLGITIPGASTSTPTSSSTALTTVGFPPNTTQQDISSIDTALKTGMVSGQKISNPIGSDGYIDPSGYVTMMNYWIQEGGTKAAFLSKFPVKTYINPANTWVWGQIGIANPYVKTTTTSTRSA